MATKRYFVREKLLLKIFGLSFTGNESIAYRVYSFIFLALTNFGYPLLAFAELFKHDFSVVSGMLTYQFSASAAMAKTAVMIRNRLKIGRLISKLEQEPFLPNSQRGGDKEEELVEECLMITNAQTMVYWVLAALSLLAANIYAFSTRLRNDDYNKWEFPYGPFTILNVTYSPNYEISFFYQSFAIVSVSVHFATIDLMTASILAHISYQFKILQNNLRKLVKNGFNEMEKTKNYSDKDHPFDNSCVQWKYLKKSVKEAVHYHLAVIDLAKEMEEVFSNVLLFVYLGTLGMLCFLTYHISETPLSGAMIMRSVVEVGAVSMQVLTTCFWGDQVMHESQNTALAAYEADFVGTDTKFQKALMLIIQRGQNRIRITAGKFTDICLTTFIWILRMSYSIFMVLQSVNREPK